MTNIKVLCKYHILYIGCTSVHKYSDRINTDFISRLDLELTCKRVTEMTPEEVQWAFDLTKRNMEALLVPYDRSAVIH